MEWTLIFLALGLFLLVAIEETETERERTESMGVALHRCGISLSALCDDARATAMESFLRRANGSQFLPCRAQQCARIRLSVAAKFHRYAMNDVGLDLYSNPEACTDRLKPS